MDLEQEMQTLLHEESFLDSLIEKLSGLLDYNNLSKCSADAQKLLEKLKDTRTNIHEKIQDLTNEMIITAEACALDSVGYNN